MGTIMDNHLSTVQGLVHLWNESGIQIMVLLSFGMQVFLLVFGAIRRRSSSAFLRPTLWLVYLLADSTAIYALGHLSVGRGGGSSQHQHQQLLPFWAPFLLLHLGGPDNITAYALEDNQLWKRHLQILIVQALAAAYVTYKSMASGGTLLLLLASISMFVVGLAKYGERTWALKCSRISSIRSTLTYHESKDPCQLVAHAMSDKDILPVAHHSLHICKAAFTDFPVKFRDGDNNGFGPSTRDSVLRQYKLVEMELSLMYDTLYTKAAVIHTSYGICIRIVSVLGTATAFLLFHLHLTSRTSSRGNNNNGYNGGDVIVSYVLLVGALVLEAISLCKALVSSWTRSLWHSGQWWGWLLRALDFLGELVQPASSRLWQGSIGQYNLFHLCTRDSNQLGSKLAKMMKLDDWWNKLHFTSFFTPDDDFKELLHQAVPLPHNCDQRGISILKKTRGLLESLSLREEHFGKNFNESILIWSIVTEKCIHQDKGNANAGTGYITGLPRRSEKDLGKVIQAIGVLSNYLMFLLVVKPEMLPSPRPQKAHADVCRAWDRIWGRPHHGGDERNSSAALQHKSWNPLNVIKEQFQRLNELFHQDDPHAPSRIQQRKELVSYMLSREYDKKFDGIDHDHAPVLPLIDGTNGTNYGPRNICSNKLAEAASVTVETNYCHANIRCKATKIWEALTGNVRWSDTVEIMLKVWAEMLVYAVEHCSRDSHARNLTDHGGEFSTIMWLMVKHDMRRRGVVATKAQEVFELEVPFPMLEMYSAPMEEPFPMLEMCTTLIEVPLNSSSARSTTSPRAESSMAGLTRAHGEDEEQDGEPLLPPCPLEEEEPLAEAVPLQVVIERSPSFQLGEIDEEELKQYDGSDPTKPLLMAIKGQIYDVTQSRMSYGPGGQYSLFAAKDASRAIAKMSFEPEDQTSDISGLEPFELDALQDWEDSFMSNYAKVGTIKKSVPMQREETKALPSI